MGAAAAALSFTDAAASSSFTERGVAWVDESSPPYTVSPTFSSAPSPPLAPSPPPFHGWTPPITAAKLRRMRICKANARAVGNQDRGYTLSAISQLRPGEARQRRKDMNLTRRLGSAHGVTDPGCAPRSAIATVDMVVVTRMARAAEGV
eukprot:NODE_22249_length_716_cov_2.025467.p1 GENE.NODE_22249_length_716_cov_2.025467~~NODE_22249_length_716_cov_2.025467.p1  ORF type:complete len:162 (-),score=35.89 NODE_22249_length_716_cov_2.025467:231-677(-)